MDVDTRTEAPRRLSMPLTARDQRDLKVLRNSPTGLSQLPGGVAPDSSEAKLVHAVFEEGMRVLKEQALEAAYAEMGAETRERSQRRREQIAGRRRGAAGLP